MKSQITTTNPYNNKTLETYDYFSSEEINTILNSANNTFKSWKKEPLSQKTELLKDVADNLSENKEKYSRLMSLEMGKPITESTSEIEKCMYLCDFYAENASILLADDIIETDAKESFISFDPLGCILGIMPWNFPFWQAFRFAVPTLTAGNTVVLKHASNVTGCALTIEKIFEEAGYPKGCFSTLIANHDTIENIIKNDVIKAVSLTGSEKAGRAIAKIAGEQLKPTVLELGGNNACVILNDANLDEHLNTIVKARMQNTGQSCIAAKRFIVVEEVYEQFVDIFVKAMSELKQGDPNEEGVDYGPMAREDLAEQLLEQTQKSVDKGAELLLGGDRPDKKGAFFNPTILGNVKPGMPAYDEELFGPVASVFKVKDEEEAILIANDSPYGLGGCVWTQDIEKGKHMVRQVESGAVYINKMTASHPALPFGGVKLSGYGRELSYLGIREFVNQKTVWMER